MKSGIRIFILIFITAAAGFMMTAGCGTDVGVVEEEFRIDPPPSDVNSAGVLSGFGYATAGEHYKTVHSLGHPLAESDQSSANGKYKVK